ncbi:hypothetical protein SSP24_17220 [Streptomyces spinoverrucosus]|uniref:Uncharacterized protein n=1 Tax=Streptomyces spinoverrucosus TaxID=284043 RepID=A0A4Y3VAR7_9ACTN|nr:hypothetical protein SSP24_17220 [Streptomyces spinoverrucosus]GHB45874.1 hypothetical protein GCM10010397_14680 [Streptomyces spinoverrucosus]
MFRGKSGSRTVVTTQEPNGRAALPVRPALPGAPTEARAGVTGSAGQALQDLS